MKRLKKWTYLVLMTAMGLIYLTWIDGWQVYAEPLSKVQALIRGSEDDGQENRLADSLGDPVSDGLGEQDGKAENLDVVKDAETAPVAEPVSAAEQEDQEESETAPKTGDLEPQQDSGDDDEESSGFGDGGDPVYMTVEDDYFADAVFIGDSRTVGLYEYGGLEEISAFYASTGLTVYKIFSAEIVEVPGQRQKITIEEALNENQFKKIYLMIGINEMGMGTVETFTTRYKEVVDHLLELQPEAIVYIQGILKVTTERSKKGDYINNEGIVARNEALSELADNVRIFYLDVNPLICDDTGGMEPSYTFDGVHLKAKYVEIWKDYLKSHAIDL